MQITADNEQGNLTAVGSPIVLQRRGSVYGANVPMITGNRKNIVRFHSNLSRQISNKVNISQMHLLRLSRYFDYGKRIFYL